MVVGILEEVRLAKAALRGQVRKAISAICDSDRAEQSAVIVEKILNHPQYLVSKRLSIFVSTRSEVNTDLILMDAFERRKRVFVPRFHKGSDLMEMVEVHSWEDYKQLPSVMWGIRQPLLTDKRHDCFASVNENGSARSGLDLVIAPGCAFTLDGKRLGQGRGYYDRFFAKYYQHFGSLPYTIGVSFREQIVDDLPTNEFDMNLDEVITYEMEECG